MLRQKYVAAYDKVKTKFALGIANKPGSNPRAMVGTYITRLIVDHFVTSKIYQSSNICTLSEKLKFIAHKIPAALLAEAAASGNCDEHLAVSLYHLLKSGFSRIEVFCALDYSALDQKDTLGSHIFVVAERDRAANPLLPHLWQSGVLFDPYEDKLVSTDMASFPKTMEELTSLKKPTTNIICTVDDRLLAEEWKVLYGTLQVFREYLATLDIKKLIRADMHLPESLLKSMGISNFSALQMRLLKRIDEELEVIKPLFSRSSSPEEKQQAGPDKPFKYEFTHKTKVDTSTTLSILNSAKVLFFQGLRDDEYNMDAMAEIQTPVQLKTAITMLALLNAGQIFLQDAKYFFLLTGVNLAPKKSTDSLPTRIANLIPTMSK